MAAKFIAALIYVAVFMAFLGILAYAVSTAFFSSGDVIVLYEGIQIIPAAEFIPRFLATLGFATFGMMAFATLSMYISTASKNTLVAILVSLGILIISTLLQTFSLGVFDSWKPFLFTYHMTQWQLLFYTEIPWNDIWLSAGFLLAFTALFTWLAFAKFNKLNITE